MSHPNPRCAVPVAGCCGEVIFAMVAAVSTGELYRIGGDEFVALVPAGEHRDAVGDRLLRGLRRVTSDLSVGSDVNRVYVAFFIRMAA